MTTYTSREIAGMFPVTLRQLQCWHEQRLVRAGRKGWAREYTEAQAFRIGVIAALREKGLSLLAIRAAVRFLERDRMAPGGFMVVTLEAKVKHTVKHTRLVTEPLEVIKFAANTRGPVFLVDLRDIARRVQSAQKQLENR